MKNKTALIYLPCYRPGTKLDKRVQQAAQVAEADAELRERLRAQVKFDGQMLEAIRAIEPPRQLLRQLNALTDQSAQGAPLLRSQLFHPAMLSVIVGALLIVGFLVWLELDRMAAFPGKESVAQIVAVAKGMNGGELEVARGSVGELGDVFYMRGFDGFVVPPQLASMPVMASRIFKRDGHSIAQMAVDPHNSLLYVFRGDDFGVRLEADAKWVVFTSEEWVAAIRQDRGLCSVLAFRGDSAEMKRFLETLK